MRQARSLRGTLIGCGFFARHHLNGWQAVRGADLVAVCDREEQKARAAAAEWGVPACYSDPEELLDREQPDFVDVVTQPATHRALVELAASRGIPVICQKPMAFELEEARAMVAACAAAGVPFMVHENFRWQSPMRIARAAVGEIGPLSFGRISWRIGEDIYGNQPYLAREPKLVLADMGVHCLDLARFFLGEFTRLYGQTVHSDPRVVGEDQATVLLRAESGASCVVELSYFSLQAEELFPQTLVYLEGRDGSVSLGAGFELAVRVREQVRRDRVPPPVHPWSVPPFEAIQDSVLNIQQHWTDCLRSGSPPETSGADNLRTLELVEAAYRSAESGTVVEVPG
ncbi:MAG: Gfo/Idh/MocA family oxidoreductase [Armatimonadetes bacterium]|nr:Gfo/Idh/MocA family oxidoreductase [Armatimonadota bacterium]